MKAALFFAATLVASGAPEMAVRFANGDVLHGAFERLEEGDFLWKSNSFFEPEPLRLDRVLDLSLPGNPGLDPVEGDHIAVVRLTNGDEIRGLLTRVNEKEIAIRTNFAGELIFRRDMVDDLGIDDRPELYFAGPTGLEGWTTFGEGEWAYEGGALVSKEPGSPVTISREVGKHERYRLSFDIEWRSNAHFKLLLCADDLDPDEVANAYELTCQSNYISMRKSITRKGRLERIQIGSAVGVREFREREKVRVEILHDQLTGRIRFMLGGRVIADWREPAPGGGDPGGALHFEAQPGGAIRISRIRLTSWDGQIEGEWQENGIEFIDEDMGEEPAPKVEETGTGINLRNGDRVDGQIQGIENGIVKLASSYGEIELPVSRLRSFSLRTEEEAADPNLRWEPIKRAGDVTAWFTDGGRITFDLTGFEGDTVRAKSQTFGEAEFDLGAFTRIEFNIHLPEFAELRSSGGW